jgi:hypothetical protein
MATAFTENLERDGYRRIVMPPPVGFGAAESLL